MKNTKKVLSVALAGALAFGSMGAAFAAMPVMDAKTDNNIAKAVERLNSFGIVNGMEDGKYHEEMKVTREQFAKLLVEALGLGNAASAAKGATKFADVESSRWSAGYVNVAVGQGLLKGYPDGTFKPAAEVSYAEATTMLVRALGYKDEFLKGSWPGNYVAKAAETGITSGAKFNDAAGQADRGTVALLVNNTLDSKVVKVKEFEGSNIKFEETNKTLLKDKLGLNKYENVRIVADKLTNDALSKNKVTVKFLKDMDSDQALNVKNNYKANDIKDFDLASNVNVKNTIGEESTVYLNDKNEVVYSTSENDDKAIFDYVKATTASKELSLVKFDKDYKFAADAEVYVFNGSKGNYAKADVATIDVTTLIGKVGKFVVKNNQIVYAEILDTTEGSPFVVVKGNDAGKITGINQTNEKFAADLSKSGNYKGVVAFDQDGNSIDVKDIKAGNLVYIQKQKVDSDDYAVVRVVTNNSVTGKLGKIKDDKVEIEGKEYSIEKNTKNGTTSFDAYYSVDKDQNSKQWKSTDWSNDMKDADSAQVTAYLDASGSVAYLTTEAKASTGYKYGVITGTYADKEKVKVYAVNAQGKGEEIIYNVEESKNLDNVVLLNEYGQKPTAGITKAAIYKGAVVKFKLNKAGEIAKDELYMMDKAKYHEMNPGKDFGKETIPSKLTGGGAVQTFTVDSTTQLIGAKDLSTAALDASMDNVSVKDDFSVVKWADMASDKNDATLKYYVFSDDTNKIDAKAIIFVDKGAATADDSQAVYVMDTWLKGGDNFVKYADENGEIKEKQVATNGNVVDEKPYIVKVNSDGKIDLAPTDKGEFTKVTGKITAKNGDIITIDGVDYKLGDKTVVYEEDVKKSISNINKGDIINIIVENGVNVRVVERLIDDELKAYTDGYAELTAAKDELIAAQAELVTAQAKNPQVPAEITAANDKITAANDKITKAQTKMDSVK